LNGTNESFNGKFRDECLNMQWFKNRIDAKILIEEFGRQFNEVRPPFEPRPADPGGIQATTVNNQSRNGHFRSQGRSVESRQVTNKGAERGVTDRCQSLFISIAYSCVVCHNTAR
jgi:hypothetical protein